MADEFKACSVADCKGNAHQQFRGRKGYCSAHYYRIKRYGNPLDGKVIKGEPMRFIEDFALTYSGDKCLRWPYASRDDGSSLLWVDGAYMSASRYVCMQSKGNPPTEKHEAAHSCGNGHLGCVTKKHLSWKTHSDNEADKILHGTDRSAGEKNPNAKISDADVMAIKSMASSGKRNAEIGYLFGVSKSHVGNILRGARRPI